MGHNAHAVGENRPEVEKSMISKADVCICISHTLHLALPTFRAQNIRYIFPRRLCLKGLLQILTFFSKLTPKNKPPRRVATSTWNWNSGKRKLCKASCYLQNGYSDFWWNLSRYSWNKGGGRLTRHGRFASLYPIADRLPIELTVPELRTSSIQSSFGGMGRVSHVQIRLLHEFHGEACFALTFDSN